MTALAALATVLGLTLGLVLSAARPAGAQGLEVLWGPEVGCLSVASHSTGMFGDGEGEILLPAGEGEVVVAFLQWIGAADTTPDAADLGPENRAAAPRERP